VLNLPTLDATLQVSEVLPLPAPGYSVAGGGATEKLIAPHRGFAERKPQICSLPVGIGMNRPVADPAARAGSGIADLGGSLLDSPVSRGWVDHVMPPSAEARNTGAPALVNGPTMICPAPAVTRIAPIPGAV
jgi:hypothetical protein